MKKQAVQGATELPSYRATESKPNKLSNVFKPDKFLLQLIFWLLMLFSFGVQAQAQTPIYITWDESVGCQESPRVSEYIEFIESGRCLNVCQSSSVTYTLSGINSSWSTVNWNVIGGQITSQTPMGTCTVLWSATATDGLIGATVITNTNTVITIADLCVKLIKNPEALFTVAPFTPENQPVTTEVCIRDVVCFTNYSNDNGGSSLVGSALWEFYPPNGGPVVSLTGDAPCFEFSQVGEYTVVLTVTNICNCKSSYELRINAQAEGIDIECPAVVCEGQRATYSLPDGFNGGCSEFSWSVIGGIIVSEAPYGPSIEIEWTDNNPNPDPEIIETGFGYVTFDPHSCTADCFATTTLKIPIIANSGTIKGDTLLCGYTQQRYSLPQWPTTDFQWEIINAGDTNAVVIITDQHNEVIVEPGDNPGTFILRATYKNTLLHCGGTAEISITLKNTAVINGSHQVCLGSTESYTLESGASATWQIKKLPNGATTAVTGTSLSYLFSSIGDYSITVNGVNFCSATSFLVKVANIIAPNIAELGILPFVCPSTPSIFTLNNTVPGTVIGWEIALGAGYIVGSSYGNEITVNFNFPPMAPYILKVWRESVSAPFCKSAILEIPLTYEILDLNINGITIPSLPNLLPCGSTQQTYQVAETTGDLYTWSVDPVFAGSIVQNGNPLVEVLWNQFAVSQTATLKLVVTKCNIPQESSKIITITSPEISIVPSAVSFCRGTPQTFSVAGTPALNTATTGSITWDFGDGTTATGETVTHAFNAISQNTINYDVTVTVVNPNACTTVLTKTVPVTVKVAPVAYISPADSYTAPNAASISLSLSATMQNGYGVTTSVVWYSVAGGLISPQPSLGSPYTVTAFGSYYAVVSNADCSTTTNTVVVSQPIPGSGCQVTPVEPVLDLTLAENCGTVTATATNTVTPVSVEWSATGLMSNTATAAAYVFEKAGSYNISYTANYLVSGSLCPRSKTKNIIVPYVADIKYAVSCGNSNNYIVKLLDHSNYFPATPIQNWVFKVDGVVKPQLAGDTATERNITLAPGNYTLQIEVQGSGKPMCSKAITLVLPNMPDASFTFNNNVCKGEAVEFEAVDQPGVTYSWAFGDDTFNLQQDPVKAYSDSNPKFPVLTVTNQYGCVATSLPVTVTILPKNLGGAINSPILACVGGSVPLSFDPGFFETPLTYQWLMNNQPIPGPAGTSYPYNATQQGSYGVIVTAANGCTQKIADGVAVAFVQPPAFAINGLHNTCAGQEISLTATVGAASNLQFYWTRSGLSGFLSNQPYITDTPPAAGTYTYTLEVKSPLGNGLFCSTSIPHTVIVYDPPTAPDLTFDITCNPYTVNLHATAESQGVFNWSNGMSGANITVHNGGPFEVSFTNGNGCMASTQLEIPKDPQNFLWVFPTGCYTLCRKEGEGFLGSSLLGTNLAEFAHWSWLQNNINVLSGSDNVLPYELPNGSATYNLMIDNGFCAVTSDAMNLQVEACDCTIQSDFQGVTIINNDFMYYQLGMVINNPYNTVLVVTVTVPDFAGVLVPSTVSVPSGGGYFEFSLIPDGIFPGGAVVIELRTTNEYGELCQGSLSVSIPSNAQRSSKEQDAKGVFEGTGLEVIPNPVINQVQLWYEFGDLQDTSVLQLYDTLGRLLETHTASSQKGQWMLDMSQYQAGHYIVVMKKNDKVVQQKILILTH